MYITSHKSTVSTNWARDAICNEQLRGTEEKCSSDHLGLCRQFARQANQSQTVPTLLIRNYDALMTIPADLAGIHVKKCQSSIVDYDKYVFPRSYKSYLSDLLCMCPMCPGLDIDVNFL